MAERLIKWKYEWITEEENAKRLAMGWSNPTPTVSEVPPPPPMNVSELAEVPARRLRKDIMAVYKALGGEQYLLNVAKTDPDLFHKLLLKVIPQAVEADVRMEATINRNIETMTTAELKALVMARMSAEIDVTPTENDNSQNAQSDEPS
jgi:hypothetical protein